MTFQALLFCPDEKTARVTTQVLTELEFSVEPCSEPFNAVKKLMGQHFDAVVVDCADEQNATLLFKSARNSTSNQAALAVAVVEGQAGVANAFRIGANLVLTKPINVEQAKSTLRVARGLLRKGTEGGKPAGPPTPTAAPPAAPPQSPRPASVTPAVSRPVTAPSIPKPAAPPIKPSLEPAVAKTTPEPMAVARPEIRSPAATGLIAAQPPAAAPSSAASELFVKPPSATASGKVPIQPAKPGLSPTSSGKVPVFQPKPVLRSGVGVTPAGAAAAPAPAKETTKPLAPVFQENSPLGSGEKRNPALTSNLFEAPAVPTVSAPKFSAFDSDEPEQSAGGSKTGIMVAIILLVLAAAAYFGYTKLTKKSAPATSPQSQPASPETPPLSSTGTPDLQQASAVVTAPAAAAHESVASAHTPAAVKPADPEPDAEPEVVVEHPADKPIRVKSDSSTRPAPKKGEEIGSPEVAAPPALSAVASAEPSAISNIVASVPVEMPKAAVPESLRVSQGVTQGLLLKRVEPVYPRQAVQMRLAGPVQIQAMIDKQGRITSAKVLKGDPVLARAAVEAVKQWRYKPYMLDGQPVDIETQITINFKLP